MRRVAVLVAALGLVAACSGGGDDAADTTGSTSTSTSSTAPETTAADTTDSPTTTVAAGPVYPLTGLPVTDEAAAQRPALVVKIDNNRLARPQSGLNEADIVFEEIVEVQTRFAAIFHSQVSDPVGPIRSGRTQDIDLLGSFNQPLFTWSGGNRNVTRAIQASDLVSLSAQNLASYNGGGFFRSNDRRSPHNLYAQTTKLWTLAPADAGPPPQQFQYLGPDDTPAGDPAAGAAGDMDGLSITWTYDPATGSYARTSAGEPHRDANGDAQVTTENVVVMYVVYRPSPADRRSPEAQTIGTGDALVFTGGTWQQVTWTRDDRLSPVELTDADGQPVLLTPGRTFVELARQDTFLPIL